jgi:hypothetical protein
MAELERALVTLDSMQTAAAAAAATPQQPSSNTSTLLQPTLSAPAAAGRSSSFTQQQPQQQGLVLGSCAAAEGLVLHKLQRVFSEARAVYRLKDSSSRYSEWPHLQVRLHNKIGCLLCKGVVLFYECGCI